MPKIVSAEEAAARLADVLTEKVGEVYGAGAKIEGLTRLSGGASRETWSFDAVSSGGERIPLILKRDPIYYRSDDTISVDEGYPVGREVEGRLVELSGGAGVPAPEVPFYLAANERTSSGFVMARLEGEALGRRIVRDDSLREARPKLAYQCGHAAARFHSIPVADLPALEKSDAQAKLDRCRETLDDCKHPYPGFEYGLSWLAERIELSGDRQTLVHGDFRNGNILVDRTGLIGVLDWELAHVGNPLLDLGWICVRSWRYGHVSKRVGGFGETEDLLAGYEAGGGPPVDLRSLHFWEVYGTLNWGMLCITMAFRHLEGPIQSIEKAVIGRRSAETEYDLLALVD